MKEKREKVKSGEKRQAKDSGSHGIRKPQQDRSMATRERIIEAGFRLFSKKGYHKTNSKEIARSAGTGIGTFYDYFADKKALFLEILRRHRDEFLASMPVPDLKPDLPEGEGNRIVTVFIRHVLTFHENAPEFHKEAVLLRHSDPDVEGILEEWDEANRGLINTLLTEMADQVRPKDREAAAYILLRAVEDIVHFIQLTKVPIAKERLKRELADMINMYLFGNNGVDIPITRG